MTHQIPYYQLTQKILMRVKTIDPDYNSEPAELKSTYSPFEPDTIFDLIVAELAGTRSMYSLALSNYTRQAYRTRDAGIIERAYQMADYLQARPVALEMALLWDEITPNNPDVKSYAALELLRSQYYMQAYEQIVALLTLNGNAPLMSWRISGYRSNQRHTRQQL